MLFKSSFYSQILNFCPDFFPHAGKRVDKKAKFNFKFYGVTDWITDNY